MGKRLKKQLKQLICELLLNVLHRETGLIKHGEIGEDSKATPEKVVYQPFAKNQN